MKTTMRLSIAVAVTLLAACNSSPAPTPAPGDFAPRATYVAPARTVSRGLEQVSMPQSSKETFAPILDLPTVTEQDAIVNVPAGAPGRYVVPVDAISADSFIYLVVGTSSEDEMNAALADIVVTSPTGEVLNGLAAPRKAASGVATPAPKPAPSIPLAGKPVGEYVVQVGTTAAAYSLTIKAQQPTSTLTLTATSSTPELLLGSDASVDVKIADGSSPITGATVVGHLVDPTIAKTADVTFTAIGGGVYRATGLGASFNPSSAPGVWHVFVEADGTTAGGATFKRFASTAFDFVVPTAQITDASTTRVVRDDTGLVTGFEVDVTVESKASDRYEVSALLTAQGADGKEHPLVRAQTADVIDPGTGKLTLHFDAGYARLAGLEGDFIVRDLMLYSQGVYAPIQRSLAGNGQRFSAVHLKDLVTRTELPPRVYEMQRNGLL